LAQSGHCGGLRVLALSDVSGVLNIGHRHRFFNVVRDGEGKRKSLKSSNFPERFGWIGVEENVLRDVGDGYAIGHRARLSL
jgi:hypothetical protein